MMESPFKLTRRTPERDEWLVGYATARVALEVRDRLRNDGLGEYVVVDARTGNTVEHPDPHPGPAPQGGARLGGKRATGRKGRGHGEDGSP